MYGGEIYAGAPLQLRTTVGAGAGIVMHKVDGVIGREAVNARASDRAHQIIFVGCYKIGIFYAKALGGILGKIQHVTGLNIDHTPVVQSFAAILPMENFTIF